MFLKNIKIEKTRLEPGRRPTSGAGAVQSNSRPRCVRTQPAIGGPRRPSAEADSRSRTAQDKRGPSAEGGKVQEGLQQLGWL